MRFRHPFATSRPRRAIPYRERCRIVFDTVMSAAHYSAALSYEVAQA